MFNKGEEIIVIQFFYDLVNLTLLQHLIKYYLVWLVYTLLCFSLLWINKKSE